MKIPYLKESKEDKHPEISSSCPWNESSDETREETEQIKRISDGGDEEGTSKHL